jgi:arylsulfatase A-like enzyme
VLFTRAYCQQAVCNPSRVSLLTGLRPDTTKVWDLVTEMRSVMPDVVHVAAAFPQHGYRAVAYGKIFHNPFPDAASWDEPTHNAENVIAYSEENRKRLAEFRLKMKASGKSDDAITRMRGPATEIQDEPDDKNFDGKQTGDALAKLELSAPIHRSFWPCRYPAASTVHHAQAVLGSPRAGQATAENRFLPKSAGGRIRRPQFGRVL